MYYIYIEKSGKTYLYQMINIFDEIKNYNNEFTIEVIEYIITPEKIISANVGNCKGVLAIVENGQYSAVDLTKDHNINDINEMKRIMNNGGEIKNGDKIYIKNCDIPGIDTTRSFGDKFGIGIGIWDYPYIKCHYFILFTSMF